MKKFTCLLLVFSLIFVCTACMGGDDMTVTQRTDNAAAEPEKKAGATFTGLPALQEISYKVTDPDNERKLPESKIAHAYGVSKNGEPHRVSVESESFFESGKYKAVTYDNKADGKYLYLTFDCGYDNGNAEKILDVLKEKKVPAAFFCTLDDIKSEPELIARMIKEGHIVGNHSTSHPSFPSISRTEMARELEECENFLRVNFGYSSKYFRFPKGEYSVSALDLIGSLGFTSVFWSLAYEDWDTKNQKGSDYAFQKVTSRLHPGAIILLHAVSSDNAGAMARIIDYARAEGYQFKSLDAITLS